MVLLFDVSVVLLVIGLLGEVEGEILFLNLRLIGVEGEYDGMIRVMGLCLCNVFVMVVLFDVVSVVGLL